MQTMKKKAGHPLIYTENFEHLSDELRHLDLLISQQVNRFRQRHLNPEEEADSQLFITHERINRLLNEEDDNGADSTMEDLLGERIETHRQAIDGKVAESQAAGVHLTLPFLGEMFQLSPLERQIVVIYLAPELDRKYDTLYAYLQDDYSRRKPGRDLVFHILGLTLRERWLVYPLLSPGAPLRKSGILQPIAAPVAGADSSGSALELDPRLVHYILGNNTPDERLAAFTRLYMPDISMDQVLVNHQTRQNLRNLVWRHIDRRGAFEKLILSFHGPRGAGKRDLAAAVCSELGCPLLLLDVALLPAEAAERDRSLRLAFREGLLSRAIVLLENVSSLRQAADNGDVVGKRLNRWVAEFGWLVFLADEEPWPLTDGFHDVEFLSLTIPDAEVPLREQAWQRQLEDQTPDQAPDELANWSATLARTFVLTPGQITEAALQARANSAMNGGTAPALTDYSAACRDQSHHHLEELACRIPTTFGWTDLVLPGDKIGLLREVCNQVRHQYRVLTEWGFGGRLSSGKGQSVLFSGPPGTGKTMAAQVIARDLQLDLYRIDLSGVVSKYIGETEKNLSRIFREAERSNVILFFDEADALFGKRTEISDARDRYANIETSYLLQKMESHEGMVILATNLRSNMDEAFTRRLRFIIEFPFPDEQQRERIWQNHLPTAMPLAEEIDCAFLAGRFVLSGANIRNIVLNGAFCAAAENSPGLAMRHLIHGLKREYEKIGRLWDEQKILTENRQEGRS